MMKKRLLNILLLLIVVLPMFSINVYADSFVGDCASLANSQTFKDYISSHYNITDFKCTKDSTYPYLVEVSYPIQRKCVFGTVPVGLMKKEVSACSSISVNSVASGEIGKMSEGTITSCPTSGYTPQLPAGATCKTEATANIAATTTIAISKQLNMSEVDINIVNGGVKITGLMKDDDDAWNMIYTKYKAVIVSITGFCAMTCVLVFIILAVKLGGTAGNPQARKKTMTGMMVSGIGTVALGAVAFFFAFFYNFV